MGKIEKWTLEGAVYFVVEAVDFASSCEGDELDFFGIAGFEAHGGSGGDIEAKSTRGFAIESEGFVDFVEMEVAADLDGAVAGIADSGGNGGEADVGLQLFIGWLWDDFSRYHWMGL